VAREKLAEIETHVTAEVESAAERVREQRDARMPEGSVTEYPGFSAGVRQPGLTARL
jgi:hypothetical protein